MKALAKIYFAHHSVKLYIVLLALSLCSALISGPRPPLTSLGIFFFPALLAPFFEWAVHKYLLHFIADQKKHPRLYHYMANLHYKHHWAPNDLDLVFSPISAPLTLFIAFIPIGYFVLKDIQTLFILESGVIFYYLFYEWMHLSHHYAHYVPLTKPGRILRNAHNWHHHKNENYWWGVTNTLGDWVLGTFKDPKEVEFRKDAKTLGMLQKQ